MEENRLFNNEETSSVDREQFLAKQKLMGEKANLERQFHGGADWFFWIAGLSLVNTVIMLAGGNWNFVIGLGITQLVDVIAGHFGGIAKFIALGFDLFVACAFAGFGLLARRKNNWAFITGMILYALDGLLFILAFDLLAIGFHILALYCLFTGLKANNKLRAFEENSPMVM
ncbi:MAG: hypothetical protein ABRQ37_28145 [Candidatus Eremiobacterota bacterium]